MRNEHKRLSVRLLRKRAENGVFRPNISIVEKKCVDSAIDCWLNSEAPSIEHRSSTQPLNPLPPPHFLLFEHE